jgi:CYTH domain-containing protein
MDAGQSEQRNLPHSRRFVRGLRRVEIISTLTNTSAPAGKSQRYAKPERERRFLLASQPPGEIKKTVRIVDRYFLGTRLRLRQMVETGGDSAKTFYKLTQKVPAPDGAPGLLSTVYLNEKEFALLATIPGSTLRKTRHSIPPFGVDVFESPLAGLFLAEVEFDDDASMIAFSPPPWIVAEVTRDSPFTGGHLVSLRPSDLEALLLPFDLHSGAE